MAEAMEHETADTPAEAAARWATARHQLRFIAEHVGEWAGIPMPIEGGRMVVDKAYPFAEILNPPADADAPGAGEIDVEAADGTEVRRRIRSRFWSWHRRADVLVLETPDGRVAAGDWATVPRTNHLLNELNTLGAAVAWGWEQETAALELLEGLVTAHAFKSYCLAGAFLESSPRSGVTYMFRRLRPTIAITMRGAHPRILAALCLHPIAYYEGSWAGAMCPTDDVVAHLMLMRGDERLFWSRANQHPSWRPEAGL